MPAAVQFDNAESVGGVSFGSSATHTCYFVDAAATGSSHGTAQLDGSAPSVATMGTGWVLGTAHSSNEYSNLVYASISAATNFSTTVKPPAAPLTTNCFRLDADANGTPLKGLFSAGSWAFKFAVLMTSAGTSGNANLRLRVFRSKNKDGSSATEITASPVAFGTFAIATTTQQNTTATWSGPRFSLNNEYLFFELALEVVSGAVSVTGSTCKLVQDGTNSQFTTPAFRTTTLNSDHTVCFFARVTANNAFNTGLYEYANNLGDGSFGHEIKTQADGLTVAYYAPNASDPGTIVGPKLDLNQWYFFALVVSGGGTAKRLYWQKVGQAALQFSSGTSGSDSYAPQGVWLGAEVDNAVSNQDSLVGQIAGFRLWSGVELSMADVEAESGQIRARKRTGLTIEWDFENAQGGRYADKSGNGYRATENLPAGAVLYVSGPQIPRTRAVPLPRWASGTTIGVLAGQVDAIAGASGAVTGTGVIAGSSDATTTATAAIVAHGVLAGEADATSATTGLAVPILPAAGRADALAGGSGSILATGVLAASAAAVGGASAALHGNLPAAGVAAGIGGASAGIFAAGTLAGRVDAAAGASGAIAGLGELAGEADASSGAVGTAGALAQVAGTAAGQGGASATLGATVLVTGEADARAGASAAAVGAGALAGAAAGVGGASALPDAIGELAGASAAVAGAVGQLGQVGLLQGSAAATSGATGTIRGELVMPCIEQEIAAILVPLAELPAVVAGDRLSAPAAALLSPIAAVLVPLDAAAAPVAGDRLQAPVEVPLLSLSAPAVAALALLSVVVAGDRLSTEPECNPP